MPGGFFGMILCVQIAGLSMKYFDVIFIKRKFIPVRMVSAVRV